MMSAPSIGEPEGAQSNPSPPSPDVSSGWYPDPDRPHSQRYWDGNKWTDQIAPLASAEVLKPSKTATPAIIWPKATTFLGAAMIVIGTIGPWATTALESIAGTSTDGKWCIAAGVLALILLAAARVILFNILIALAVAAEAVHRISNVNAIRSKPSDRRSIRRQWVGGYG
jgi:hypothetical protein